MFRISSVYCRFTALLLPAVLLWSWMACVLVCDELTEHSRQISAISTLDTCGESVNETSGLDGCNLTATPATFPDRQTVDTPALITAQIVIESVHRSAFVPFITKSDINQNSPPKTAVPLFLRLHNFRI